MSRWNVSSSDEALRECWSEDNYAEGVRDCLRLVEPVLELTSEKIVVDIGCGVGRLTIPLAWDHPSCKFVGLDTSPEMLRFAEEAAGELTNVDWRLGTQLPDEVDAAFSVLVFQHVGPFVVRDYMEQLAHKLFPGGVFRFQFVEGDHHSEDDHRYREDWMLSELGYAGLRWVTISRGLVYPEWTWITAERPRC